MIKQDNDKGGNDPRGTAAPNDIVQTTGNGDAVIFEGITNPAQLWMVETWGANKKTFKLPDDQQDAVAFQKQTMAKKFQIYAVASGKILE